MFNRLRPRKKPAMPALSSSTFAGRKRIADDTLARAKSIVKEHAADGASLSSTFIDDQLEPLAPIDEPSGKFPLSKVEVVNSDAFTLARKIIAEDIEAKGKTAVLNLASDEAPGGGWLYSLSRTQEEALCYASTLYSTLKKSYYPWPNVGSGSVAGAYSPGVVIFKDDLDHNCQELEVHERQVVSVITVAAPRHRPLTEDYLNFKDPSVLEDLKGKIRLVYRIAAHNAQTHLVLGAMGCGAYACPPRLVADQMKSILLEPEFNGRFRRVAFAVYDRAGASTDPDAPPSNFDMFSEVFKDVTINA